MLFTPEQRQEYKQRVKTTEDLKKLSDELGFTFSVVRKELGLEQKDFKMENKTLNHKRFYELLFLKDELRPKNEIIENIIGVCKKDFSIKLDKKEISDFFETINLEQLGTETAMKKSGYFFNELTDNSLLFSYVTGLIPITAGHYKYKDSNTSKVYEKDIQERTINSVLDLYLLRKTEIGYIHGTPEDEEKVKKRNSSKRTDLNLFNLIKRYNVRQQTAKSLNYEFATFVESVDAIGKHKSVREHLLTDWKKRLKEFEKEHNIKIGKEQRALIQKYANGKIRLSKLINYSSSPNPLTSDYGGKRSTGWKKKTYAKVEDIEERKNP